MTAMVDRNDTELLMKPQSDRLRAAMANIEEMCGPKAASILNSALDENDRLIDEFFSRGARE